MKRHLSVIAVLLLSACGGSTPTTAATDKPAGGSGPGGNVAVAVEALCKIKDNGDGSKLITCDDGTSATVRDGVDGADGKNGAPGSPGTNGSDGADGLNGATGSTGAIGAKGAKGDQGLKGDKGATGAPGATGGSPCPTGTIYGSYTADNEAALAAIVNCTDVTGDLYIGGIGIATVALPNLISVGNRITIQGHEVTTLQNITAIDLTSLESASSLEITMTMVTSLALPALTTATTQFDVNSNTVLTSLSAPALTTAARFQVGSNTLLATLSAPLLTTVTDTFSVAGNPQLPACQAVNLRNQLTNTPDNTNTQGNKGTCP